MDGWIGEHGGHDGLDGAGRFVWHASTRATTGMEEATRLPNPAPQCAGSSTSVDPHKADLIDALIASTLRVCNILGAHAPRAAAGVANAGR